MAKKLLAATRKGLFTVDRGKEWRITGVDFLGDNCSAVMVNPADGTMLAALDHGHFGAKLHRSTDGGRRWTELEGVSPSAFGFALAAHPSNPETAWLVPEIKDERRIPVDGKLVVNRTRDGGKSFETLSRGLPQEHAYDLVYRHGLAIDAKGETLAMGSTTGSLFVSEDSGDSWQCVSTHLPPVYALRFAESAPR